VTIQSKANEEHVFKDQERRKNKTKVEWNRKEVQEVYGGNHTKNVGN
jgi:hypothetical protein